MQFGKVGKTEILDDNGSSKTAETNIVKGVVNKPVRVRYEIKTRVHNQKEEHEALLAFSDDLSRDKTKLDPMCRWERSKLGADKGYYYLVSCYTVLEY